MKHLNSFFILAFLTISLLTTKAQTSVVIDPDNYSFTNPYIVPNLPNLSTFYLVIKTGKPVYVTISGMDNGSTYYLKTGSTNQINNLQNNIISITECNTWIWQYTVNGVSNSIVIIVNYQADIFDRTVGSATYGKRPDFIWVNQGESATVNAGAWIHPNGSNLESGCFWLNMDESIISSGYTDSIKSFFKGTYALKTVDGSGIYPNGVTRDTISILEKPTFNNTTKTLNFSTTTTGITYKLLKAGFISGTDTTWTETENFVGDGNAKNIALTDGKYKLTTTFGIHTSVYPYGYFIVGVTTGLDNTKQENINYRLFDNKLQFDKEVNLKFYSLQGQLLQQENGSSFKLVRQSGIFKATDKNGNTLTAKILLK